MFAKLESATSQSEKDKILSELQPVITYASIAVDECDFGTGLEIGINLFCSGLPELEPSALSSLVSTYSLLKRDAFSKIIQVWFIVPDCYELLFDLISELLPTDVFIILFTGTPEVPTQRGKHVYYGKLTTNIMHEVFCT